jgi:hypothetical protein
MADDSYAAWQLARQSRAVLRCLDPINVEDPSTFEQALGELRASFEEVSTSTDALELSVAQARDTLATTGRGQTIAELFRCSRQVDDSLETASQRLSAARSLVEIVLADVARLPLAPTTTDAPEGDGLVDPYMVRPGTRDYWLRPCPATARDEYPPPYP